MDSISKFYKIFTDCFDFIPMSIDVFERKISSCHMINEYADGEIIGFSAVNENSIVLICIHPDFQDKKYGSKLLLKSEKYIYEQGYRKVIIGRSDCDLFFGAVMDNFSHRFFEKRGYVAYNGCLGMYLKSENFDYGTTTIEKQASTDAVYSVCNKEKFGELLETVSLVEPKWVRHFKSYENVMTASVDGKIVGFLLLEPDADTLITTADNKTGLFRYLGVLSENRKKHIGSGLMIHGIKYLVDKGCTDLFINYTSLDQWYMRFGFKDYIWYLMCEKNLGDI